MTGRVIVLLVMLVVAAVGVTASLGFAKVVELTAENAAIRIDRAARSASTLLTNAYGDTFRARRDASGRPVALEVLHTAPRDPLASRHGYGDMVLAIGSANQGAANLFRYDAASGRFQRSETTFRKPDGSMPPPMSIGPGHPAYANIAAGRPHVGEVPVMGRLRLAHLTPILDATGALAGALAVDVGWSDDLTRARRELGWQFLGVALLLLLVVCSVGALRMRREMRPLGDIARFADALAGGNEDAPVPHGKRSDEIGALAQGLGRVAGLQEKLGRLAYEDPLTGFGNRVRYMKDTRATLEAGSGGAILRLNLCGFKIVNDAFGQARGDAVLRAFAALLRDTFGGQARIARLDGDDFAVCLGSAGTNLPSLCAELRQRVRASRTLFPEGLQADVRIGVIMVRDGDRSPDDVHRGAELALRRTGELDSEQIVFFSDAIDDEAQRGTLLEVRLREAITRQQLHVHFQPQIDARDGSLTGLEALARWNDEVLGTVSPGEFVPVAERVGLVADLGQFVLERSCALARGWLDAGFEFGHVSVNVSPIQLWQPDFVDRVASVLRHNDLPPHRLCLEVTEGVFAGPDEARTKSVLDDLRQLGVHLSLDDFGAGYSSLAYLNRLPFDQLKVDRSFISGIDRDPRRTGVLRGIVSLGTGLGLSIVVEGVETQAEADIVRDLGCCAIQGFLYARPMSALSVQEEADRIRRRFEADKEGRERNVGNACADFEPIALGALAVAGAHG